MQLQRKFENTFGFSTIRKYAPYACFVCIVFCANHDSQPLLRRRLHKVLIVADGSHRQDNECIQLYR